MTRFPVRILCLMTMAITSAFAADFSVVTRGGTRFTVVQVDLSKERLQLFLKDAANQPLKTFDALQTMVNAKGEKLVFAMNAGMYHGDFSPVGLCVIDGKQVNPLNLANAEGNFFLKPNGAFLINEKGAQIMESSQVPKAAGKVQLATQSGPLLVINNALHPVFKEGSKNRLYRNGVGVVSPTKVVFAISEEPVNFHEFALLFRDALKCPNALFLDGTISSLYAPEMKRNDRKMDLGPIIGITRPK